MHALPLNNHLLYTNVAVLFFCFSKKEAKNKKITIQTVQFDVPHCPLLEGQKHIRTSCAYWSACELCWTMMMCHQRGAGSGGNCLHVSLQTKTVAGDGESRKHWHFFKVSCWVNDCSQWSRCSRDETKPSTTEVQLDSVVWASLENARSGRSRPVLSLYDCAIRAWSSHKQGGAALDLFDCPLRRPVLFPPLGWRHVEGLGLAF